MRRNCSEAQGTTATQMPVTDAALVDVDAHCHIEQMLRRFSVRVVVLVASPVRIGLFSMLSNDII